MQSIYDARIIFIVVPTSLIIIAILVYIAILNYKIRAARRALKEKFSQKME